MSRKAIDRLATEKTPEQVQKDIKAFVRLIIMGTVLLVAGIALQVFMGLKFLTIIGIVTMAVGVFNYDQNKMVAKRQAEIAKAVS